MDNRRYRVSSGGKKQARKRVSKNKVSVGNTKNMVVKSKKKVRIKYKNVLLLLLITIILILSISKIIDIRIRNVFIVGNNLLSDEEILQIAEIGDYPSNIKNSSRVIKSKLQENIYVKNVKVKKKNFNQVYIYIEENKPLFFNASINKIVLSNLVEVSDNFVVPTLINYVPDTIYKDFVEKMSLIDDSVLRRMSEIKYDPNDVDEERFLVYMNDGNYVYLTLKSFTDINEYINIVKNFNSKKGILYLDSGEYFQVLEN